MNPRRPRLAAPLACAALLLALAGCADEPAAEATPAADTAPATSATPPAEPVATHVLDIQGMHCDGCVGAIRQKLRDTPGVASADVSLEHHRATIGVTDAGPTAQALADAVTALGYTASPQPPAQTAP